MKNNFLRAAFIFIMPLLFTACFETDDEEINPDNTSNSAGASILVKMSTTSLAYECLSTYDDGYVNIRVLKPNGTEALNKQYKLNAYSSAEGAYELTVTLTSIYSTGDWTIEYYDNSGNLMETETENISESDVEKERTGSVHASISKSDAGC
ncbi:hypothetical protein [Flammeovirga aprica]|uniref:Uncharacterized protein n=1 Tax=Flammeovirga aprica JL-4 TaxID=694437 RepID=A0A7X9RVG7_9BACT|nr:hypothetical protein [Flammeovirga aprica]NME69451.1 hypothetical protein [Flammeovirga aprica JL-4]